jgi:hypothetical protein
MSISVLFRRPHVEHRLSKKKVTEREFYITDI